MALVIVAGAVGALEATGTTHFFKKTPVSKPSAPIRRLPATKSPTSKNNTPKNPAGSSSFNQQSATDNNGRTPSGVSSDPSKWLISESGNITVKLPTSNSFFKDGDSLYGSAKVSKVQYRLIDNQAGVVSQGFVSVINGNFSASVHFQHYSNSGRLDVFSTDSTGRELNEVQVPVNF